MDCPPPYTDYNNQKFVHGGHQAAPSFPPQQQHQQQQPQHHQQQQLVIVQPQMAPAFVYRPHPVSMTGAIVLSCIVFWCFGWLFGAIAFILASKSPPFFFFFHCCFLSMMLPIMPCLLLFVSYLLNSKQRTCVISMFMINNLLSCCLASKFTTKLLQESMYL